MLSHGVWAELGFIGDAEFYDMDISAWITNGALGDRNVLFLTMFWWLWRWRNIWIFGDEKWSSLVVVRKIWSSFYDFKKFLSPLPNAVHGQRVFKWLFPEEGVVKINTDGSCIQEAHKADYGGLLRDSVGQCLSMVLLGILMSCKLN